MRQPKEWNPTEIDLWQEWKEMTRLRREIMGSESYGRDIRALEDNEK